jgi:hypothetical protein
MTVPLPLRDSLLAELGAAITLRTWPEGEPVPHDVIPPSPSPSSSVGSFEVKPRTALAGRWYLFGLSTAPPLASPGPNRHVALGNGGFGARFRVGSQPLLWAVAACGKAGGVQKVMVIFSEPVEPATTIHVGIGQAARDPGCTPVPDPSSVSVNEASFACSRLDVGAPLQVRIGPGIKAARSPVEVRPVDLTIDFSPIQEISGCHYHYAALPDDSP